MEQENTPTRRSVVTVGAAAALGVAGVGSLAACSSGSSTTTTSTSAAAPAATSAAAETSAAAAGGASGAIAKLADIPVGGALAAKLDGADVILVQATAGQVTGLSAKCTHQGCSVAVKDKELDCPCHGSKFDLTGKVLNGPAGSPLAAVNVKVDGDSVVKA